MSIFVTLVRVNRRENVVGNCFHSGSAIVSRVR